jgi:hypothetical protein
MLVSSSYTPARPFTIKEVRAVIKNLNQDVGLRPHKQQNIAEIARNGNKVHHPTM